MIPLVMIYFFFLEKENKRYDISVVFMISLVIIGSWKNSREHNQGLRLTLRFL